MALLVVRVPPVVPPVMRLLALFDKVIVPAPVTLTFDPLPLIVLSVDPPNTSVIPFGWLVRLRVAPWPIKTLPLLASVATLATSLVLSKLPTLKDALVLLVNPPVTVSVLAPTPWLERFVSTLPELARLPVTVSVVFLSTSSPPVLLRVRVPDPGVAAVVAPFSTIRRPSALFSLARPLFEPAFSVPRTSSVDPPNTSVIPFGWLVRLRVAPWPIKTLPLLASVATLATSLVLSKLPTLKDALVLLVNPPVTVSVLAPTPWLERFVSTLPELARLPVTVSVVFLSTSSPPVLLRVRVPDPGVAAVVAPFSTIRRPSALFSLARPLFEPAFSVPRTSSVDPPNTSVIPFGWLVRLRVAPWPIKTLPLLASVATLATSLVLSKLPTLKDALVLLVNPPVTVSVLAPTPWLERFVSTLPELARLPVTVSVVFLSTSSPPVLLRVRVPDPGVAAVVAPFSTIRRPSALFSLARPLFEPAFSVPRTSSVDPPNTSVIPFGWLVRLRVAPWPIKTLPLLASVATLATSLVLSKLPTLKDALVLLVNPPVTVRVLAPTPWLERFVSTLPELARLPVTVSVVFLSTSSPPVLLRVRVPDPGVAAVVAPFSTIRRPSALFSLARPLFEPAFSVPRTSSVDPPNTSVIPFGWLVRFRVAPWPIKTLPLLASVATLATSLVLSKLPTLKDALVLLVNPPVTVSVLAPTPWLERFVSTLPELARLPVTVSVVFPSTSSP